MAKKKKKRRKKKSKNYKSAKQRYNLKFVLELIIKLEIACKESRIPIKKTKHLFKQAYLAVGKGVSIKRISSILCKIVNVLRDYWKK